MESKNVVTMKIKNRNAISLEVYWLVGDTPKNPQIYDSFCLTGFREK